LTAAQHPAASHHLPWFLTAPGESDVLFTITTIMLLLIVFGLGVVFFRLHSLPERLGHKKLQFEIVAVLCLLSLFTHIHLFWVIALLLALIDLPDFQTPLRSMAESLGRLANGAGAEPPQDAKKPAPPAGPGA
jgi:multisubunit Na+/H+ antiporter MnhF subunit